MALFICLWMHTLTQVILIVFVSLISLAGASDLSDFGEAIIKGDEFYLPVGDWSKLEKALHKNDSFTCPKVIWANSARR